MARIYAQIAIERLSADSIVTLEAHLKDGTEIPAHLLPFDPLDGQSAANFVIIVPHFDEREIMLEFNEYRGADAPLGRAHLTIETNMLTWRTRINSVVKNELDCADVRYRARILFRSHAHFFHRSGR